MVTQKKNTNRLERVNALIQKELGPILNSVLENEKGIVTITKVETSRDLKWAKVWVSIVGGEDKVILNMLEQNIYHIQGKLNAIFSMKIIPRIQFFLDTSARYAERINQLIQTLSDKNRAEQ